MKKIIYIALSLFVGSANAALINFNGDIQYHNDVVVINFSLDADATDVRVWTDSFQSGVNFDPVTALWTAAGDLIEQNDDDASINPATQTIYDSGFALPTLAAGDYIFTVATFNNWAAGTSLADGFNFDGESPIAISDWAQPANGTGMGSYWSVWLDGVDSATGPSPIPEPTSLTLLGLAMVAFGVSRRKKVA